MHFTDIKKTNKYIVDLWSDIAGINKVAEYKLTYEKYNKLKHLFSSSKNTLYREMEHSYYIQKFKLHTQHGFYDYYYIIREKNTYNSFVVCLGVIKNNQKINTIPLSLFLSELL
jgi:hypothetical protein